MLLMYADDLTPGSDTVCTLQKLINTLDLYYAKWGLSLNMNKTKIIVFRNGGKIKQNEKWYYRGKMLEVVSFYKYLGIM